MYRGFNNNLCWLFKLSMIFVVLDYFLWRCHFPSLHPFVDLTHIITTLSTMYMRAYFIKTVIVSSCEIIPQALMIVKFSVDLPQSLHCLNRRGGRCPSGQNQYSVLSLHRLQECIQVNFRQQTHDSFVIMVLMSISNCA